MAIPSHDIIIYLVLGLLALAAWVVPRVTIGLGLATMGYSIVSYKPGGLFADLVAWELLVAGAIVAFVPAVVAYLRGRWKRGKAGALG